MSIRKLVESELAKMSAEKLIKSELKKISIKELFRSGLTKLRRIYGAYKKYGISETLNLEDIVKIPKRPTRGSLRVLEKLENQIRSVGEGLVRREKKLRKLEEDVGTRDVNLFFENLKATMENAISARHAGAEEAMYASFRLLWDMVERAIIRDGKINTALSLVDYAQDLDNALIRIIRAIYDDEFRNKKFLEGRWQESPGGAMAYKREVEKLGAALDIKPSQALMDIMGGNLV